MKTKLPVWTIALGLLVAFPGASATVLTDSYQGGNGHGYGDVVSASGDTRFNIEGMETSLVGGQLTVIIHTNFAGHAGIFPGLTRNGGGIGYGDLLMSNGWTPNGSSPYANDNAANGNHWAYAFSLDDPLSNTGGNGTVYALGAGNIGNHNPGILLSDHFMNCGGCIYRNGQAVAVNKSLATKTNASGSWTVGNGFLSFSFDTTGLDLDPDSLGFHWTMYCGNDVIEGLAPVTVPEPAPAGIFLLGIGLIGLGVIRRRKAVQRL